MNVKRAGPGRDELPLVRVSFTQRFSGGTRLSDEQELVPTGSLICMLRRRILAILFKETKSLSVFPETS
jgi:hypothetical protein